MLPSSRFPQVHRGWILVAVAFLAVSVSFGPLIAFTFGIFLSPLSSEFGWSRGEISVAFSLAAITVSVCSPLIGRWTDRAGPRPVIAVCATVYAAAFASLSWLNGELWLLYAAYLVIGVVGNGTTQLPYSRVIAEWFDSRRGLALSLMMSGVGAGIILMPSLAQAWIDNHGWRQAYRLLGALTFLAAVPLPLLLLRPGRRRPQPESGPVAQSDARSDPQGLTVRQALRQGAFWQLLACFFLFSISLNGCVAHLAPLLTDRGLPAQQAAFAASLLGAATLTGRLLSGWLLDRFFGPWVTAAFFAMAAAATGSLLASTSPAAAWPAALLLGFAMGAEADSMAYLVSRYFGLRAFTELYGYAFSAYAVAGALGPSIMGVSFDRSGSYWQVLLGFTLSFAVAVVLLLRMPRYPVAGAAETRLAWDASSAAETPKL